MSFDASRFSLDGKVALVVGGAGDLGKAMANRLAEAGATVILSSRKIENLEKVAADIKAKGGKAAAIAAHLGKKDEIIKMIEAVKAQYGKIDVLVNSAGANPQMVPLEDLEEWAWDTVFNVNVKGMFLVSQQVAKMMKAQGGGSIVNITSYLGMTTIDLLGAYCTSKAAVAHSPRSWPRNGASTISESMPSLPPGFTAVWRTPSWPCPELMKSNSARQPSAASANRMMWRWPAFTWPPMPPASPPHRHGHRWRHAARQIVSPAQHYVNQSPLLTGEGTFLSGRTGRTRQTVQT